MLYLIIAAAVVLLDQLSKHFLTLLVKDGIVPLIPGIIRLVYVENTGAAFSLFSDMRWPLVVTSLIAIAAILVGIFRYRRELGRPACLALAFILGGAVGNLVDRVLFGYVADFFEFEFVRFAVFNVADIFITLGGIAFVLLFLLRPSDKAKQAAGAGEIEESAPEGAADAALPAEDLARETAGESGAPDAESDAQAPAKGGAAENAPEGEAPETETEPGSHAED
jgi:signal peptidase II